MAIGTSIFLLFYIIACTWIGYEVKNICQIAQHQYTGDCVQSLSQLITDETQSFHSRNDGIWSLGQLGDSRALPALQSLYNGNIPQREPYDDMVSQYELKKAINLANGGTNISAFVWRGFFNK